MFDHRDSIFRTMFVGSFLVLMLAPLTVQAAEPAAEPAMQIIKTPKGTRLGLFGTKPAAPAPTLFVFAAGVDDMDKNRFYAHTGKRLAEQGWIYVTLDPPCHEADILADEPAGLGGWAHRVKNGQNLMQPFVERCVDALNYLIVEGFTDPAQVAATGTSRGGFCALHFAAGEPRVRAVAAVSPVTNLLALREFAELTQEQVGPWGISALSEKLAGRAVWLSVGNDDQRVSTDDCVTLARALVAQSRKQKPDLKVVPVELLVGPSDGHHALDGAYDLAAVFIQKWSPRQ